MNESPAFGLKNVAVPYPVKWTGKRVECIETKAAHNRQYALVRTAAGIPQLAVVQEKASMPVMA